MPVSWASGSVEARACLFRWFVSGYYVLSYSRSSQNVDMTNGPPKRAARVKSTCSVVAPRPHAAALKFIFFACPLRHRVIRHQIVVAVR